MNRITQYLSKIFAFDSSDFDPSLPLQLNQHRHYDPTPGVWLNEEPIGYEADGANMRKYVPRVSPPTTNPTSVDTAPQTGP